MKGDLKGKVKGGTRKLLNEGFHNLHFYPVLLGCLSQEEGHM